MLKSLKILCLPLVMAVAACAHQPNSADLTEATGAASPTIRCTGGGAEFVLRDLVLASTARFYGDSTPNRDETRARVGLQLSSGGPLVQYTFNDEAGGFMLVRQLPTNVYTGTIKLYATTTPAGVSCRLGASAIICGDHWLEVETDPIIGSARLDYAATDGNGLANSHIEVDLIPEEHGWVLKGYIQHPTDGDLRLTLTPNGEIRGTAPLKDGAPATDLVCGL